MFLSTQRQTAFRVGVFEGGSFMPHHFQLRWACQSNRKAHRPVISETYLKPMAVATSANGT